MIANKIKLKKNVIHPGELKGLPPGELSLLSKKEKILKVISCKMLKIKM